MEITKKYNKIEYTKMALERLDKITEKMKK
jgi:hypothetical protein